MRRNFYYECPQASESKITKLCFEDGNVHILRMNDVDFCQKLSFSINSQSVAFVMLNHALKEILYSMCITFIALVQMYCDYIEYAAALQYWGSIRLQIHIRRCSQVNTESMHIDNINGQSQKSNKGTCFHFSLSTLRSGALWPFCQKSNNSSSSQPSNI